MLSRIIYLSALVSLAAAHGTITAVKGANGINGAGMGIDPSTPRTGTTAKPFQQDTSIIRDREIQSGKVGPCGRTNEKGALDIASEMEAASSAGLPSATSSGEVQMTLHQVNQDGAGPYTCDVSGDGGNTFQAATVTKNVPGAFLGLSTATAEDFPLNVQMPANMQCAGGPNSDACIVRCRNATPAGPFGSCAVVTNAQSAGAAGAGTGAAAATGSTAKSGSTTAAAAAAPASAAAPAAAADTGAGAKQAGGLAGLKKLFGGRRSYLNRMEAPVEKRALASAADFADQDAEDAKLEAELIADLYKRMEPVQKKRVVRSRVVGALSGYWI